MDLKHFGQNFSGCVTNWSLSVACRVLLLTSPQWDAGPSQVTLRHLLRYRRVLFMFYVPGEDILERHSVGVRCLTQKHSANTPYIRLQSLSKGFGTLHIFLAFLG